MKKNTALCMLDEFKKVKQGKRLCGAFIDHTGGVDIIFYDEDPYHPQRKHYKLTYDRDQKCYSIWKGKTMSEWVNSIRFDVKETQLKEYLSSTSPYVYDACLKYKESQL